MPDELALEDLGGHQLVGGMCLAVGEQWGLHFVVGSLDECKMRKGEGGTFASGRGSIAARKRGEDRFMPQGGACRGSIPRGEAGVQSEAEAMLLDRYLPQYDVTEAHAVVVAADTDLTWQAVRRSDLSRSAVIRVLLEMRSLPNRLQRVLKRRPPGPARPPLTLDDMERAGFLLLGESPGHEIVFGTVVQPWKAVTDEEPAPQVEPGRFAAFDAPGYVKVAFNIRVEPYGSGRALITTETRTAATDPASLRRFARYWLLAGPFSALIRRLTLRIVKSDAERRPGLMSTTRPPDA
jgi:hypothetical protein